MKYVREYINEKFTEEGDPIQDMGIGVMPIIERIKEKMLKEWRWRKSDIANEDIAKYCVQNYNKDKNINVDNCVLVLNYLFNNGVSASYKERYSYGYAADDFLTTLLWNNYDPDEKTIIKLLLDKGLKVQPTHLSSVLRNKRPVEVIKMLIDAADKSVLTTQLLNSAALYKKGEIVELLIDKGVDPTTKNHYALQQAIKNRDNKLIKILMPYLKKDYKV